MYSSTLFVLVSLCLQIVHRTLAAMLGSLSALAALAFIGDVRFIYSILMKIFKLSQELGSGTSLVL